MEPIDAPPVDLAGFRDSMEMAGIGEVVDVTIDIYLDEGCQLFEQLLGAAERGDLATVEARAHTLKSSSANVWAKGLSAILASLEDAARHEGEDMVAAAIEPLRAEFDGVVRYLRRTRTVS